MTARSFFPSRSSAVTQPVLSSPGTGMATPLLRWARRGRSPLAGARTRAAGVAMLVLPGPGLAVILLALTVLATEYGWAARLVARLRQRASRAAQPLAERLRRQR